MKTILLGMNNPYGKDPKYALFPAPEGSAGHRLWSMLHEFYTTPRGVYLAGFDRRNLIGDRIWSGSAAREAADQLIEELVQPPGTERARVVVVLGKMVWGALAWNGRLAPSPEWFSRHEMVASWWLIPHPSGRNSLYNEIAARRRAARLLHSLLDGPVC